MYLCAAVAIVRKHCLPPRVFFRSRAHVTSSLVVYTECATNFSITGGIACLAGTYVSHCCSDSQSLGVNLYLLLIIILLMKTHIHAPFAAAVTSLPYLQSCGFLSRAGAGSSSFSLFAFTFDYLGDE